MMKINQNPLPNAVKHLLSKRRQIVVTNACNLNCGGCCQLVGNFSKKQIWFISIEELEKSIKIIEQFPSTNLENRPITIFGGEPTLHPRWDEIIKLLKSHTTTQFWINTNGRLGHKREQQEDNILWWVDTHPDSQVFVQTLYAAADVVSLPSDADYWTKAQKDCAIWKKCQCSMYKGKAYFCENAGAIDWLFNQGKNGWDIEEGKNPFDKTASEIEKQASQCCKRCGWCVAEIVPRQYGKDPSFISPLNSEVKTGKSKKVLTPVTQQRWQTVLETDYVPDIGIYRITGKTNEATEIIIKANEETWIGIKKYEFSDYKQALIHGRSNHDWTIVLESNQIIPKFSFITLMNWILKENLKSKPRLNVSLPIYYSKTEDYDDDMMEPFIISNECIIGFHKNSTESYDNEIFTRLGHRDKATGRLSLLWRDDMTDIVGGIIRLE